MPERLSTLYHPNPNAPRVRTPLTLSLSTFACSLPVFAVAVRLSWLVGSEALSLHAHPSAASTVFTPSADPRLSVLRLLQAGCFVIAGAVEC